ncbi:MAG: HEAT repeat domain-containing protein [Acidobacteriota bacterium]
MKCDDVQAEVTARRIARGGEVDAEGVAGGGEGAGRVGGRAPAGRATETLPREVQEHLAGCPECRAEAEALGGLWDRLALLEVEPPTAELRERFDAVLESYRAGLEAAEGHAPAEGPANGHPGSRDDAPGGRSKGRSRPGTSWWRRVLDSIPTGRSGFQLAYGLLALILGVGIGSLVTGGGPGPGDGPSDIDRLRTEVRALHELVALSLLDAPSATERLKGVAFGSRMDRPDREVLDALLQAATDDPNVNVRLAAIEALAPVASEPRVLEPLARALPEQDSPSVQVALVDILLASDGETARQAAVSLLEREEVHPDVRRHVQERLGRSV